MNINNPTITSSNSTVGGVVGCQEKGSITEIAVRDGIITTTNHQAGGIVGYQSNGSVSGVFVAETNVTGGWAVGGIAGEKWRDLTTRGVVESGSVKATSGGAGKAVGYNSSGIVLVYVSSNVTVSRTSTNYIIDGNWYNAEYHSVGMYDDVLDTIYGGASGDYYFDYDANDKYVLKKIDSHSFDIHISGSGIESDPYILSTERDFKEAASLLNGGYYFKLGNNIDPSTYTHFYQLGTTSNYFNGHLDGNGKTISNMEINTGQYGGFIGYLNGGSVSSLNINDSIVVSRYHDDGRTGLLIGIATSGTISNLNDFEDNTVSGKYYTGGIVGYLGNGITVGEFNVYNITVTGTNYVGGVVGYNNG